jgi:hypothetical protein
VRTALRPTWAWFTLLLLLQLILGLILVIARLKGFVLPCGAWFGCASSIHDSPAILGLHLTEYAVLHPLLSLTALFFLLFRGSAIDPKRVLLPWMAFGFAASFAANAYNFVERDQVCSYCFTYGILALLGLILFQTLRSEQFKTLTSDLWSVGTIAGILACLCFAAMKLEMNSLKRSGAVQGIALSEILGPPALVLGNPRATHQVVCFYSPTCEECRDEIRSFPERVANDPNLSIYLRAVPIKDDGLTRRLAANIVKLDREQGLPEALALLLASSETQLRVVESTSPADADLEIIDRGAAVAAALSISRTPTCISIVGPDAKYVPCEAFPRTESNLASNPR